jgi:2-polyprenyl-6-methoxyphenol hydroxylase-like FAD-dependent oxidoreductase
VGHLCGVLRSALPSGIYCHGKNLLRVGAVDDVVTAYFDDGTRSAGELLVGADGLFSAVRTRFVPGIRPAYAGYVAWRGLVEEAELSLRTQEAICDRFSFCLPPGEQMLGYPVAGANENLAAGSRRFNFVWYRPAEAHGRLPELLTDVDGVRHELSIPPSKVRF